MSKLKKVRTPRNSLCFCGSGKKYKKCHGNFSFVNQAKKQVIDGIEFIKKLQSGEESSPIELIRGSDSVQK